MRLWRRGSNHKPLPGAPQAPEQLSAGKDKLPGLTMVGVPAASPRIEMMSEGSSPRVGEGSQAQSPGGPALKGPTEELQRTVVAQRFAVEDLQQTIQSQYLEIRQQRCAIEWLQGLLRAAQGRLPEEGRPEGLLDGPEGWEDEEVGEDGMGLDMDEVSQLLASQILEKLHLAEDKYRAQEEEIRLLDLSLEEREADIARLEHKISRDQKLIMALRKELSGLRRKLREQHKSTATMEVEIERYKVEKRTLSKMMSSGHYTDELGATQTLGSPNNCLDSPSLSSDYRLSSYSPDRLAYLRSTSSLEATPERRAWTGSGSPPGTPRQQQPVAGGDYLSLVAEVEAAREVAQTEAQRRAALENEVEKLKAVIRDHERSKEGLGRLRGASAADSEEDLSANGGQDGVSAAEMTSLALKDQLASLRDANPSFQCMWEPATTDFKVRGKTYMADGVKVDARDPLFELVHMELIDVNTGLDLPRADNITGMLKEVDSVYSRVRLNSQPPFLLVVNFEVPGSPACSVCVYFALKATYRERLKAEMRRMGAGGAQGSTMSSAGGSSNSLNNNHATPSPSVPPSPASRPPSIASSSPQASSVTEEEDDGGTAATIRLLAAFLLGDDEYRTSRFKLIPSVIEGPWIIKQSVGNKPVILGRKVTQRYFEGSGYLEVSVDIGSSAIASRVLSLVRDYSKNVVVEIAVLLQGENEAELPERLLGSVRFNRVDWALAEKLSARMSVPSPRSRSATAEVQSPF